MSRMKMKQEGTKIYEMTRFMYRCNICNDTIESTTEHTIVRCKCKNLTITGGIQYGGMIASIHDLITDVSEWRLLE